MQLSKGLAETLQRWFKGPQRFFKSGESAKETRTFPPVPREELLAGLDEFQRIALTYATSPQLFAVVSWGCAATNWLAHVLNGHPDIFCLHAANSVWQSFGLGPPLCGWDYFRVLWTMGRGIKAVGDVHGIARHEIKPLRKLLGEQFNAVVVIREPIQRLGSQLALFKKTRSIARRGMDYVDTLLADHGLSVPSPDPHDEARLFAHGVNMLNAIVEEVDVGAIYRSEDLTTKPTVLKNFVTELTGGSLEVSLPWASRQICRDCTNAHRGGDRPVTFNAWETDVLLALVKPEAWAHYERLGYPRPTFAKRAAY